MKYSFSMRIAISAMVALTSCAEPSSPERPSSQDRAIPRNAAAMEINAAVGGRGLRDVEDDILRMEASVPGLGGAFLEGDEIVVFVPAGSNETEVLAGLSRASLTLSLEPTTRSQLAAGTRVRLRPGSYAFSQLIAWEQELTPQLRKVVSLSFTDADEARNQISVGIVHASQKPTVLLTAARIGIPATALNILVQPLERAATTLRDEVSEVAGGMQIANINGPVCTVGWNVHRGDHAPAGEEGFFTAAHCASAAQAGSGVTGPMYQATTVRRIGFITQNPLWNVSDGGCMDSYCTRADAMYVRYDDPSESLGAQMAQPSTAGVNNNQGDRSANNFWTNLNGSASTFLVGSTVDKIGRTTGWTRGTLQSTCTNTRVDTDNAPYTVLCANKVQNAASGSGDSGGPVFQIGVNGIVKRGMLFSTRYIGLLTDPNRNWNLNSEGLPVCESQCLYSYSTWTQINLWLPQPPF